MGKVIKAADLLLDRWESRMTLAMQQTLLRRGCQRLHATLTECPDLPAGEVFMLRMSMVAITAMANRGAMLALPYRAEMQPDQKMKAANDDTFTS